MPDIDAYTELNRHAWNAIAELRQRVMWPNAEYFANGGSVLDQRVLDAAGNMRDMTLLHLQCATGEETLSWAVAGADATGVDISDRQIALAERKAAEAGLPCRFVSSDIYSLPPELRNGGFDMVYTGVGVLTWLPDIERWGDVVSAALKPGGRFLLFEGHPMAACLAVDGNRIRVAWDYFGRHEPSYHTGWGHFPGAEDTTEQKVEFSWPLGDVVTSMARAGMRIDRLEEYPTGGELHLGEHRPDGRRLPSEYLLIAHRE